MMLTANKKNALNGSESSNAGTKENRNQFLLGQKIAKFNERKGLRIGDFVRLPTIDERQEKYTRITHIWDDTIQTGGASGSCYLSKDGTIQYSGGLDSGLSRDALIPTTETKLGSVWFFSNDEVRSHNGVYLEAEMRVFDVKEGADVSGCWKALGCPFYLNTYTDKQKADFGFVYKYAVQKDSCSYKAFHTDDELHQWLKSENLILAGGKIAYPAEGKFQNSELST